MVKINHVFVGRNAQSHKSQFEMCRKDFENRLHSTPVTVQNVSSNLSTVLIYINGLHL